MRDAFAAIERADRLFDPGNLPLVALEVLVDRLRCKIKSGCGLCF
jgi:hypothetical protein